MGSNMLLTIGAILLFGLFLSLTNKLMIGNNQVAAQNEYYITALGLAQSVIDEAKTKAFDHNTDTVDVLTTAGLTDLGSLGPDGMNEAFSSPDILTSDAPYSATNRGYLSSVRFNDIDDYNGYSRLVNTPRSEGYSMRVTVRYASEINPDLASASKTYCKVMTVKVTSPFFPKVDEGGGVTVPDTIKLSYAFTY